MPSIINLMDKIAFKSMQENAATFKKEFNDNCDLIIIESKENPIFILGIERYLKFITDIKDVIESKNNGEIYYFQSNIDRNLSISERIPSISLEHYIEVINKNYLSYFQDPFVNDAIYFYFIIDKCDDRGVENNLFKLLGNIINIFNKNDLIFNYFNSIETDSNFLDFHCLCNGIYVSYIYNLKSDKPEKIDKSYGELFIEAKYTVKDFKDLIEHKISTIFSSVIESTPFYYLNNRTNKIFREELLIIYYYILNNNFSSDTIIELGQDTQRWDAKIESTIIELTQAIYQDEYLVRRKLCNIHCFRGTSLRLRTLNQIGIDSFPTPILKAIEKKQKKNYGDERILIVCTLFEFAQFNNKIVSMWLNYLENKIDFKIFSEIILSIDETQITLRAPTT